MLIAVIEVFGWLAVAAYIQRSVQVASEKR
jgi:hypothetical protein